jgi:hypothetical protein
MSKEKQLFEDLVEIFEEEYEKRRLITPQNTAEKMTAKGYRKQSEWISVEERLPDAIDSYIVVVKQKYEWEAEWEYDTDVASFVFCDGYIDGVWNTYNDWKEGQECHITHWMPIPEPPKMKGGAE